ncbi:MAG TPA: ATP cone domain-containing protein, partial [Candidatus Nanoarchaeia archaeon]|nr:ATP cone domain-containing protein [Candidatus Nanoarchaeia archaeon]
ILKKDQRRESFDKNKLKTGLLKACEKRPVPVEKVEQVADKIEAELLQLKRKEIPSTLIGEKVMKELKKIDKVAYIRFASVYRDFKDVDDFKKEIKELK